MIATAFIAAALVWQAQTLAPKAPAQDSVLRAKVATAERTFFLQWQRLWQQSARELLAGEYGMADSDDRNHPERSVSMRQDPRMGDELCFLGIAASVVDRADHAWGAPENVRKIWSHTNPKRAVCPNWYPPPDYYYYVPSIQDERDGIDGALTPRSRLTARNSRRRVATLVDSAVHVLPTDNFLIGQLVRLHVDDAHFDAAWAAAENCRAERWWCLALSGYVLDRRGDIAGADSAYSAAIAAAPASTRCAFTDVRMLVDDDARPVLNALTCEKRDSVANVLWWLADPLWSVPGNNRRVEHFTRYVTAALHAATQRDERFDWSVEGGGDAMAELVRRYGWPTFVHPPHSSIDTVWRAIGDSACCINTAKPTVFYENRGFPPGFLTTFEYRLGRVHVVPSWDVLRDPFSAQNDAWSIAAPRGEWDAQFAWWPREHYASRYPLLALGDQQTALLRRDSTTMLAYATNLAQTEIGRHLADSVRVRYVVSPSPDSIAVVDSASSVAGDRVVLVEPIGSRPAMISIEIPPGRNGEPAARSRFGVRPPPALASMAKSETAISDIVVLGVPAETGALPLDPDSAVALMRGSTTFTSGTHSLGVYWETYGIGAGDSVDVSLAVKRRNATSALHRLGEAVGVTTMPTNVSVSWQEPQPQHAALTLPSRVPIQARSVIVDITSLEPGDYVLEISVARARGMPVVAQRQFTLQR